MNKIVQSGSAFLPALPLLAAPTAAIPQKPNVLFIMARNAASSSVVG
jgi:hypothetical protein